MSTPVDLEFLPQIFPENSPSDSTSSPLGPEGGSLDNDGMAGAGEKALTIHAAGQLLIPLHFSLSLT